MKNALSRRRVAAPVHHRPLLSALSPSRRRITALSPSLTVAADLILVNCQVIKIKQEIEKIKHPSLETELYMRRLKDVKRLQSRSPLGLAERTIILCHS
ncbi:hypothetical protein QL285_028633 [Trifolium repens]|nr:hypothetical protein QL285_028633 [Trifolium repens]